ncbi:MAG: VWA domain-containing protein [Campylobacterota bacterium]|nr:VWA domain-containing protein [Campylobacterota bacterium]
MHPQFLWLLPIVIILFYFIMTQKEHQALFFSDAVLNRLRVTTNMLTLKARNALFALMMIFVVIALAGPAITDGKVNVQAKSADIMVALDISDSMLAEDMYPNRLALAKDKILDLLQKSPQERIGVMGFAKDAYLVSPLSFDHASVAFLMKQLNTDSITEKGTDFTQLLFSASELLSKNRDKYLLILTDGGDENDFSEVIAQAKEKNIKVFVLGVGKSDGVPIVDTRNGGYIKQNGSIILTRLNENISKLATQTGGSYIEAISSDEDVDAMINEMHAKTQRKTLKEEEVIQYIALFYYPLGLAMLLFLIATSSLSKRKKVEVPMALMLSSLFLAAQPARADLMDFRLLDEAAQSYEAEDYNRSQLLYGDYAHRTKDAEAYYNQGNAYYKQGDFKNAQNMYKKVFSDDENLKQSALHNLGNSYAKEASKESLEQAVNSYEKALKIKDDKETSENLEEVKKALEKLKQQEQEKQDDKQEEGDKKQQDEQEKKDKQKSDKESKEKDADEKKKGDEQSQEKSDKNSDKQSEQEKKKEQDRQEQQQKEEQSQKSDKSKEEEKKEPAKAGATKSDKVMSDLEEQKWLKELNKNRAGHLYQLQRTENRNERTYEKPW